MADTANSRETAKAIGRFLEEHRGVDTQVLDLAGRSSWTDYFVITTVLSSAHLQGLIRQLYDFLSEASLEPRRRYRQVEETGWLIVDCGDIVIHLMDAEKRKFYDLENLWFQSKNLSYSSKSS